MKLTQTQPAIKSAIEADSFFTPLASVAHDGYAGGDVLLCDDLLPSSTTLNDEMERGLEERGLAIVSALMEGGSDGDPEEVRELSTVLIIVTENVVANRSASGFGQTALAVMQRIKQVLATASFSDASGGALVYTGFSKGDAPQGTVSYYLEYQAKTHN